MPRGRRALTEEEKEQKRLEKEAQDAQNQKDLTTFFSLTITELTSFELVSDYFSKVKSLKGADEKQILKALLEGFINGSIEFEERTVLTVKKK